MCQLVRLSVEIIMNSETEIKIRKYENHLRTAGTGVIVFGVWIFLKLLIYILLLPERLLGLEYIQSDSIVKIVVIIFLTIIMSADILFRVYIGKRAIAEAKGIKKGYAYIILSFPIAINSIYSLFYDFTTIHSILDLAANVVTELTSAIITVDLISSAFLLKKYNKMHLQERKNSIKE